jgi:hypothetical protein
LLHPHRRPSAIKKIRGYCCSNRRRCGVEEKRRVR